MSTKVFNKVLYWSCLVKVKLQKFLVFKWVTCSGEREQVAGIIVWFYLYSSKNQYDKYNLHKFKLTEHYQWDLGITSYNGKPLKNWKYWSRWLSLTIKYPAVLLCTKCKISNLSLATCFLFHQSRSHMFIYS